jgi:glycosyltransferase involved in cell wall biosynthesis
MKIVHLVGWYFPDSVGGTEVYVEGLCRRLRDAGHQILIAAPTTDSSRAGVYLHDGTPVFRYTIAAEPTRDEANHRVPVRGAAALYQWLGQQRPDLIHVHSLTTGIGLPEIREARRQGIRVVATCHLPGLGFMCRTGELMEQGRQPCDGIVHPARCTSCTLTHLGLAPNAARWIAAVPAGASAALGRVPGRVGTTLGMRASVQEYAAMQRELFDLVDAFVVLNSRARQMLIANGSPADKITVNRLGLSQSMTPVRSQRSSSRPVRFAYVGRLHRAKGLMVLAEAIRSISPALEFQIEIRGPALDRESQEVQLALQSLLAGDRRVTFLPPVSPSAIPSILADCDVLLCPSISFENGPTVALEAHAVGTPVVGSSVGGLNELIHDRINGRLLTPGDAAEWAATLSEIAVDPEGTVNEWRRCLVTPRTMDDIARDYLALYAA